MRYEDWTYREAEVRLAEHSELRRALQLRSVPDYTTLYRFLRRLDEAAITRALNEVVHRIPLPGPHRRTPVAVDATGLSPGAISTFFVRRLYHHNQQPMPWRHWLKWLVAVDLDRQLVLAQKAHAGPTNDGANLRPLVDAAHTVSTIGLVLADAEFDSELNHTHIRQQLGARSVIPAKRGKKTWRIHGVRAEMRDHFPRRLYRRRALSRNHLLRRQTQALLPRARPTPAHAASPSLAARSHLQPLSPVARDLVPRDVNRASRSKWLGVRAYISPHF